MQDRILVGTAGWTDRTLIASGRFYPKGCSSAEARLRYYAERFPLVEVDSSYYALPSYKNAALWAERTPDGFTFNVKAFRLLTQHRTPPQAMPPDLLRALGPLPARQLTYKDVPADIRDEIWTRYRNALEPLRAAGKLGAVLFQFAPWFIASRDAYDYLRDVRERLAGYVVAIEFRHRSWMALGQRAGTLKFEAEHAFVNVVVDEPQGAPNSIPMIWEVTNPDLAIVRLHGRNRGTWQNTTAATPPSDRFNYDYSDDELARLVPPVAQILESALKVHVIFNNNFEDQGQRNAGTFIGLVGGLRRNDEA